MLSERLNTSRRDFCENLRCSRFAWGAKASAWRCRTRPTAPRSEQRRSSVDVPVAIAVASFDDIATVLELRLDERTAAGVVDVDEPEHRSGDDDIDSLRDLASGAPVVRAVNDLLERAMELRASDIHIEPFRAALVVRMRVDGILRAGRFQAIAPPQAVVSRIKILAGLTSRNAGCLKTAPHGRGSDGLRSMSASPPCRRSTARASSSACCLAIAACSI